MKTDIQACGIACPTDWLPLPLDPAEDIGTWSKRAAAEVCERSRVAGYVLDKRTVRKDLKSRADDSRQRAPLYAFALYPDGFDSALALLEVDLVHPDDTVPEITLEWLESAFSAHDFGPPQTARAQLPIGPAVRIRQNFAADAPPRGAAGVLLETLTYGILPDGARSALMFLMSWTVPGLDEDLEKAAEEIVRTLTVDF